MISDHLGITPFGDIYFGKPLTPLRSRAWVYYSYVILFILIRVDMFWRLLETAVFLYFSILNFKKKRRVCSADRIPSSNYWHDKNDFKKCIGRVFDVKLRFNSPKNHKQLLKLIYGSYALRSKKLCRQF